MQTIWLWWLPSYWMSYNSLVLFVDRAIKIGLNHCLLKCCHFIFILLAWLICWSGYLVSFITRLFSERFNSPWPYFFSYHSIWISWLLEQLHLKLRRCIGAKVVASNYSLEIWSWRLKSQVQALSASRLFCHSLWLHQRLIFVDFEINSLTLSTPNQKKALICN